MIMGLSDDFSAKGMVSGNINSAVVPDETVIHLHTTIVIEGTGDGIVPKMNVSGGCFYVLMGLFNSGHDHGSEVFRG